MTHHTFKIMTKKRFYILKYALLAVCYSHVRKIKQPLHTHMLTNSVIFFSSKKHENWLISQLIVNSNQKEGD